MSAPQEGGAPTAGERLCKAISDSMRDAATGSHVDMPALKLKQLPIDHALLPKKPLRDEQLRGPDGRPTEAYATSGLVKVKVPSRSHLVVGHHPPKGFGLTIVVARPLRPTGCQSTSACCRRFAYWRCLSSRDSPPASTRFRKRRSRVTWIAFEASSADGRAQSLCSCCSDPAWLETRRLRQRP